MREPESLHDFNSTFIDKREALNAINPLSIDFPPNTSFMLGKGFLAEKFVERINGVLHERDPRNLHFIMPMVGQHATYEFLKGVLKVLSPAVKIPVTALKTPARYLLNDNEEGRDHRAAVNAETTFRDAVNAALDKHGSTRENTHFVVIDFFGGGTTKRAFERHLGRGFEFIPDREFSNLNIGEYHLTKDKNNDGRMTVSRGELLDIILKQGPDSPPEKRLGPDDFLHHGELLFNALREAKPRYFTPEEAKGIAGDEAFDLPANYEKTKKWPPIIDLIRDRLPTNRREEIVVKLKKDDVMLSRMAYQYGIAQALNYLQKH